MPMFSLPRFGLVHLLPLLVACTAGKRDTSDFFEEPDGDRKDPLVVLSAPASGATVSGDVPWLAEASDDVGVVTVTLRVDDVAVDLDDTEPWGGSWDATTVNNGTHTLEVEAADAAGNTGTSAVDVLVDNEGGLDPGAILITNPTDGATVCGTVAVQTSTSAEVVQVVFSLDGTEQETDTSSPFAWDWDTTTNANITHTLSALASNAEGGEAVASVQVLVSNEEDACDNAPSVVFTDPMEGDIVRGVVDVNVSAVDDIAVSSVLLTVDSGTLATDTAVPYQTALDTTGFADGAHTLGAVATDSGGQTGSAEISITVDNEAPVVAITEPSDADALAGIVAFTAEATDNLGIASVALSADGVLVETLVTEPYTVDLDTTAMAYGTHELSVLATDLAGNEATDTLTITVDNPPVLVFTEPLDTTVYGEVTVAAEATDDDRLKDVSLYQDGTLVDATTAGVSVSTSINTCSLAYGTTIDMEATATDAADNEGSETLTLTVDQLLQVGIDTYTGALDYTDTLGANVNDDQSVSSVVWALDGTTIASTTRSSGTVAACFDCGCKRYTTDWSTASASEGTHTLSVTVTNTAGDSASDSTTVTVDYDQDDDGYDAELYGGDDCDDEDASYHPGVTEACDGEDEDCDGEADDAYDVDGDGYLDMDLCTGTAVGTDCDDADATVYPGATETCDEVDDDCDGYVDNTSDWTSPTSYFGTSSESILANGMYGNVYKATRNGTITGFYGYITPNATRGSTSLTWAIYVATSETGTYTLVDSNDTSTSSSSSGWYSAGDFDVEMVGGSYYLLAVTSHSSGGAMYRVGDKSPSFDSGGGLTVAGYIGGSSSATSFTTDPATSQIFYQYVNTTVPTASDADADADGITVGCGDCDDLDDTVAPDATEICDELDNDCDDTVDEAPDTDDDGEDACSDCDDGDPSSYTGGTEVCDDADNDCDGSVDDDATDGATYYVDGDADGYGLSSSTKVLCEDTAGYARLGGDCDDADAAQSPGDAEICNAIDDDCDGTADEGFDADGDGYGTGSSCGSTEDCDDTDPEINIAGTETCNDTDDDCDGEVDEDATDGLTVYVDADGDGYGNSSLSDVMCAVESGYSTAKADCDDTSASVNPGAVESCNSTDDDCDGTKDEGFDADSDGYASCSECDDTDADVNPSETEVCSNGIDDDCDGEDTHCVWDGSYDMETTGYTIMSTGGSIQLGRSVDGGGDMDGDGSSDALIGVGYSSYGIVYVLPGDNVADMTTSSSAIYGIQGEDSGDCFGYAVAWVADQDGDGYDDLLAGAYGDDEGETLAGAAFLFAGPITGDIYATFAPDASLLGEDETDKAGMAIEDAGDMDGDGTHDLMVSAPYAETGSKSEAGVVYVVLGPPASSASLASADLVISGTYTSDYIGFDTAGDGDQDGDGYSDILVASPGYSTTGTGAVFLIEGPATGTMSISTSDAILTGSSGSMDLGDAVAMGDVDGDGYDDVMAAASDYGYTLSEQGAVYIFYGPVATTTTASADVKIYGAAKSDFFGNAISASDLDEDGTDDLLIGAAYDSDGGSKSGVCSLFYGPVTSSVSSSSSRDAKFVGEDADDYFGMDLDATGDFNGSGGPDLLFGATNVDVGGDVGGAVYIVEQ